MTNHHGVLFFFFRKPPPKGYIVLKKTIEYDDFDGKHCREDFYFNLTPADIAMMDAKHEGGFEGYLKEIQATENGGAIMLALQDIIGTAYGVRSTDMKSFRKSEETRADFLSSNAYVELFMSFINNPESIAEFMLGILPEKLRAKAEAAMKTDGEDNRPAYLKEDREPTKLELRGMNNEELIAAMERMNERRNATSPDENK